jgi:hypothetical protein
MKVERAGKLVKHLFVAMPTLGAFLRRKPLETKTGLGAVISFQDRALFHGSG